MRCIRRIRNSKYSPEYLEQLLQEKRTILSKNDKKIYRDALIGIEEKIDDVLYISDIISVHFSDTRHYERIIKNGGIKLNGKNYVRLLCGSGNARQNTVLFCNDEIIEDVRYFLNCGRNLNYKINKNKFNAYFALANSGSHPVSLPIFIVIPDLTVERKMIVDKVSESPKGKDALVEETEIIQKINLWDGMGIISPDFAWQWATEDLGLDYLPASFILRIPFGKGLITVFDFKELAKQNNIKIIKDIYGKEHFVDDIDLILTESQFKLTGAYENLDQYRDEMKKRNFSFGISRVSPREDKDTADLCYQYLQALNIQTDEDIEFICRDSVNWLKNVSFEQQWMLLFLLSGLTKEKMDLAWFERLNDPFIKALLLDINVANDDYIRSYIGRMVRKIEKEMFKGSLRVNANYQFVVADPFALGQHALGLSVMGLLKEKESYSQYWNNRGIDEVTAFRSPTTGRSEPTPLFLKKSFELDDWFKYQTTNIVFNIYDDTAMRLSGCDYDGDLILTTPYLNKYVYGGLIPYYDRKTAEKQEIIESELWEADAKGFGSSVGLLTNFSTSIFSMIPLFEDDSIEKHVLIDRLKIATTMQNMIIDSQKGISVMSFPSWWADKEKEEDKEILSEEELALYEHVRVTKRPYFFKYVYETYNRQYKKHLETYESLSQIRLGSSFAELQKKSEKTDDEEMMVRNFYKYSPLLDSFSIMNRICRFMEAEVAKIRRDRKNPMFDWHIYINDDIELDISKLQKMREVYKEFSDSKRNSHDTGKLSRDQKDENSIIFKRKMYEISSSISEIANLAVQVAYGEFPKRSKDFCWSLIPTGIIFNLNKNNIIRVVQLPFENENGDTIYLNKKYEWYALEI